MIDNKKILAVIPARGGSKGVPGKNIRFIGGKPLVAHVLEAALASNEIECVVLSSDDQSILDVGYVYGETIPLKRPLRFATDNVPLISVILDVYGYFRKFEIEYDAVISIQPTCPFLTTKTIDNAIKLWRLNSCDSVVSIAEIVNGHPYIAKRLLDKSVIENFCPIPDGAAVAPRQEREKAYYLTGGIYLRDKRLLEIADRHGHCLGNRSRAVIVDEIEAVDINTPTDFEFAEFLMGSRKVRK